MNNPAIKRLARELQEIQEDFINNTDRLIEAEPLKDDMFEWHFTMRGPDNSDYSCGFYHGRIVFPADYPFSPPSISFLTPNGRWEVEKKICLSVTGYHPESWQPAWGIRTILLALRDHFTVEDKAAIGYLDYPSESRKELARKSTKWKCKSCPYKAANDAASSLDITPVASTDSFVNGNSFIWILSVVLLVLSILLSYIYLIN